MRYAKLFPPPADDASEETCTVGKTIALKDITFQPIPNLPPNPNETLWVDGGSAVLFNTPSRCIAVVKVTTVFTRGMVRENITTAVYLVSITAGSKFLVRAEPLANPDARITAALNRDIEPQLYPDATSEQLLDTVRTLAEHAIDGNVIRDGSNRSTDPTLQKLPKSAAISKTSGILTSKHRPLAMALLSSAPSGTWHAPIGDVTLARLDNRASHVFLVEKSTPELLALLRLWSADITFPGYPYPLVLADQLARVTNNERDALKVIIASDEQASRIIAGELKSSDAHAMLEHILYGKEM